MPACDMQGPEEAVLLVIPCAIRKQLGEITHQFLKPPKRPRSLFPKIDTPLMHVQIDVFPDYVIL